MPIHLLPPEVVSQIAAGEVVERPVSVVKELIENSLDAHASFISIKVEGAGKRLIEVIDDGCGIPAHELPLSVSRHATSKISTSNDLFNINTLGFRGEALASIGSVTQLTLTSRQAGADTGALLTMKAGTLQQVKPVGAPQGTVVRVENLFFNIPARLKFLKSDITERRLIDELVTRYALAYPHVRFQLNQEQRISLQTSGNGNQREVLAVLYGVEMARQMLEVVAEYDELRVKGFISPLTIVRSNRRDITFFVNGRWVHDSALVSALLQAYHTLLMVGRYPIAGLLLEVRPDAVDVNVHPAKAEVRFREKDKIFSAVQRAVRRALLAHSPLPTVDKQPSWGLSQVTVPGVDSAVISPDIHLPQVPQHDETQAQLPYSQVSLLRLIGQVASSYIVAEGPDGLYLIDQHAAHERVLFERFMNKNGEKVVSQTLLQPLVSDFPSSSARLLESQLAILVKYGFQVESFGAHSFLIRAIPSFLTGIDPRSTLRVLVDDFEEDETPLVNEMEARVIARVCKRSAIKAGQPLSIEEQQSLVRDLEKCQSPRTCPHGRPTMIHLSVELLERQFGRR